jgi:inorganic pyrophosphatase
MAERKVRVFIEIPKGDDRRRHLSHDKSKMLDLGPTKRVIPVNKGIMPIAYGFIIGTLQMEESAKNPNEIPDEVDILVYSKRDFKVGEKTSTTPIAIMARKDGDHKVVAVDSTTIRKIRKWGDIPLGERDLILKYFGYKSPIISVRGASAAVDYIERNRVRKPKSKTGKRQNVSRHDPRLIKPWKM